MRRQPYARVTEAMCAHCTAPFEARLSELARGRGQFCSRACKYAASRGRDMTLCSCEGCGKVFERHTYLTKRPSGRVFCGNDCARRGFSHERRVEIGRMGGSAPHRQASAEDKFRRSSAGGQARYATLTKARLREIGRMGVAARAARPAYLRRAAARKAARTAGKTLHWFGIPITSGAASGCASPQASQGVRSPAGSNPVGARPLLEVSGDD